MSHLFHTSPVPPRPSCRIRPVSEGRGRICSSPRRRRWRRAAPGPPPGGLPKPQSPAARCLSQRAPLMMATPRAKSQVDHVPTETRISNGLGSHSCAPITTSSTFKPIPSQVSAIFVDLLQALGVHLQQASDSSDVAFFCSLQDVSASKRPKLWMSGSPRFILNILYYQWISHNCIIMS